jgi:Flp pilus assembly protein TadB
LLKCSKSIEERTQATFNAANHLFVSTRIAKEFMQFPISKAILQFSTPWPIQSFTRDLDKSEESLSKKINEYMSSLTEYCFVILNIFINMPNNLQDNIIQFISTSIIDGFIVTCIILYNISSFLAIVLIAVVLFITLYLFFRKTSQFSQSNNNFNEISCATQNVVANNSSNKK